MQHIVLCGHSQWELPAAQTLHKKWFFPLFLCSDCDGDVGEREEDIEPDDELSKMEDESEGDTPPEILARFMK